MLKELPEKDIMLIAYIANALMRFGHFTDDKKIAQVTMSLLLLNMSRIHT